MGASRFDIMTKVGIPRSLPLFFGALKVVDHAGLCRSSSASRTPPILGIGNLITRASADFNVPDLRGVIVLRCSAVFLVAIVDIVEARMTGWAKRSQMGNG